MLVILFIMLFIFVLSFLGCLLIIFFIMVRVNVLLKVIDIEFFIFGFIILIRLEILFLVILFCLCFGLFGVNLVCVIVFIMLSKLLMKGFIKLVFM